MIKGLFKDDLNDDENRAAASPIKFRWKKLFFK